MIPINNYFVCRVGTVGQSNVSYPTMFNQNAFFKLQYIFETSFALYMQFIAAVILFILKFPVIWKHMYIISLILFILKKVDG